MHQTLSIGDDVSAANCDCAQGSDVEDSKAPSLNGPSTAAVDSGDTLAGKHSPFRVWANRALWTAGLLASLYTFLACLGLMGTSFKVLTGRSAGNLFSSIVRCVAPQIVGSYMHACMLMLWRLSQSNPLAAMTVGVMATSALQSSSTTTSIAVALVGADALDIPTAIYIIMGANIGTSVTNTIVAVTQVHNAENFARAVAGATVHDMFNLLTVAILLPVEVLTGYLRRLTEVLVAPVSSSSGYVRGASKTQTSQTEQRVTSGPLSCTALHCTQQQVYVAHQEVGGSCGEAHSRRRQEKSRTGGARRAGGGIARQVGAVS